MSVLRNIFPWISAAALLAAMTPGIAALAESPATPTAGQMLAQGRADDALAALQKTLATNPKDAAALNLQCRVYLSEGRFDEAEAPCQNAVDLQPNDSDYHLWLGRVLGNQAEHAPMLQAYGLAKKVHAQFELAYKLNPHNADAVADLGEYYVSAPRILGGGNGKAEALADAVEKWSPVTAHTMRAEIARDAKDNDRAEAEFRAAAASPSARPENWIALANFYQKTNRIPEMLSAIDRAIGMDSLHDDALVSAAGLLEKTNQRPDQAVTLLRQYLASSHQSEDAPAFEVHARLASLLTKQGDSAGAQKEIAQAKALASGWQPKRSEG